MRPNHRFLAPLVAALFLAAGAATAGNDSPPTTAKGEVIAVHQQIRTANGGTFTELTLRTRQQQEMRLRLGPEAAAAYGVAVGDAIRVRLMAGGPQDGAYLVRTMKNQRTGQLDTLRTLDGDLLQTRDQKRLRDGTGDGTPDRIRQRDRVHEPGTGGGNGGGRRGGGGRGAR